MCARRRFDVGGAAVHSPMKTTFFSRAIGLALAMALAHTALGKIVTRTVEYKDGDLTCKGYLAYDDAQSGARPGVLVCPEWWGLNDYAKKRAEEVAALGYVAFAMDPYGDGKVVDTPEEAGKLAGALYAPDEKTGKREAMRRRAMAALATLKAQKECDGTRLASIGYCFGGTVSLELARAAAEGENLKAVVSFHGALSQTDMDDAKNIKASVLVCHGAVDPMVKDDEVAKFKEEMDGADVDYVFMSFANAVHSFTNPGADKRGIPGVAYNEKADKRSWEAMKDLLAERFGTGGKTAVAQSGEKPE